MADDDDIETNRQEHVFVQLRETMADTKTCEKIFLALCVVPIAANQATMIIDAIAQFLHPKAKP